MVNRGCALVALVLAGAACGGAGKGAATCEERATALSTYLKGMDREQSLVAPDVTLALRDDLPRGQPAQAPYLSIARGGVSFQGRAMGDASDAELLESLEATRRKLEDDLALGLRRDPVRADELLVAIDGDAPWSRVESTLRTAAAGGFARFTLAFARTPAAQAPPPPSPIDGELTAIFESDSQNKATQLAGVAKKVVARCDALTRAFGRVAGDGEDKAEALISAVGPALIECRCKADLPSVQALFYRLLHDAHPTAWLTLELAADAPALTAAPGATWRDVGARLAPGRFSLAPRT